MAATSKPDSTSPASDPASPGQTTERNPQNGQATRDRSLDESDADELPDGGANSSRHTGDESRH